MAAATTAVIPGHSLGPIALGASIHEVLSIVKDDKEQYPAIDLHYSQTEPLSTPVVVSLPGNGIRLRFDGADQRLRLIEVTDLRTIKLAYKGSELVKTHEDSPATSGPAFKRVYSLFGPSYPGEYLAPKNRSPTGTYVLSWPGVAFTFPLLHSAWSKEKDHVSLLGSHVASPATHMALFEGKSWPEARRDLFLKPPAGPRLSVLASRSKDSLPAELEEARVLGDGRIELLRSQAPAFCITLNETTPQDLVTEIGPPDAVHRREEQAATPDPGVHRRTGSTSRPISNGRAHPGSQPSSYSSTGTDTFDADFDSGDAEEDPTERASREKFWCYFSHGLDILIGPPSDTTSASNTGPTRTPLSTSPHLVVLKVIIHGNVPGSYAFNRHRRLRWNIVIPTHTLQSEQHFDHDMKPALLSAFTGVWPDSEMGKGKVVNRTWGGSGPSDSSYFLPDEDEDIVADGGGSEQWLGNTKLFAFPGLVFEVLENGAVSGLTVY
ncbi:hypothetical protein LTR36_002841 [Oleoguttula mirabilis]|uniref:Uncharacterized protein n=1 Tax=Oleoguttula mirabilis TaxID=1507867 RepID=A0AAV9JKF8_9PEZI|nr:hypothetical protein LTR36_002841 [Oleoguttula mirabilis]